MAKTKYYIQLSEEERTLLTKIVCEQRESERTVMRAKILLMSDVTQEILRTANHQKAIRNGVQGCCAKSQLRKALSHTLRLLQPGKFLIMKPHTIKMPIKQRRPSYQNEMICAFPLFMILSAGMRPISHSTHLE